MVLLNDLPVVELMTELSRRKADFKGSKKKLVERLKELLIVEGFDPDSHQFGLGDNVGNIILAICSCPICFAPATGPIFFCPKGHFVCNSCQPQVTDFCPTCRGPPPLIRCFPMEEVVAKVTGWQNCRHPGCNERFRTEDRSDHEANCPCKPLWWMEVVGVIKENRNDILWGLAGLLNLLYWY